MLLIDVDNFKLYNDTYGDSEGDRMLANVAALIRKVTRDSDLAFRYGGDEFMVILPETDGNGADTVITRILDKWSRMVENDAPFLSMGRSTFDGKTEIAAENLVREADENMYASRRIKLLPERQGVTG